MFSSYLSFSRNNREMIIFKDTFSELYAAIKKNSVITFSSSSAEDKVFNVKPYMIAPSKEEQCNYLLCSDSHERLLRTFRVSRINALFTTSDKFIPNENDLKYDKIPPLTNIDFEEEFKVRYNDIDVNMHANNGNYIVWALEALGWEFQSKHKLKSLDMSFKKEIKSGERLISKAQKTDMNIKYHNNDGRTTD